MFNSWNCIWKYRLRNDDHFVKGVGAVGGQPLNPMSFIV